MYNEKAGLQWTKKIHDFMETCRLFYSIFVIVLEERNGFGDSLPLPFLSLSIALFYYDSHPITQALSPNLPCTKRYHFLNQKLII